MKILDCESVESTYKSLETILGIKKSNLCQLFDSVDVYEEKEMHETFWGFLLSYIQKKTHCKTDFDKACFFHATCTWPGNNYEDGLLPTAQANGKICNFLSNKLDNGQTTIASGGNPTIWPAKYACGGPFGFLIREIAFVRNINFSDFFKSPEIVEDIGLKKMYQKYTVPCIVKFFDQWTPTTKSWEPTKALSTALLYTYHKHRDRQLDDPLDSLTYPFDGGNVPVPPKNILGVKLVT